MVILEVELDKYARRGYSQNGEEGVIEEIFRRIGTSNKFCVDLGAYNAIQSSNVAALLDDGWDGILIDGSAKSENPRAIVHNHFITAENVNDILMQYNCPEEFDFLSIDLDGNDYWIWNALRFHPRVVCIEYNGHIPPDQSKVIEYEPNFISKNDDYFGASLAALSDLGNKKGYRLIYCDVAGVNAFFVEYYSMDKFDSYEIEEIWRPLFFGPYSKSNLEMMDI